MADYNLVEKEAFTVAGIGVELKSHYTDQEGLNREKASFFDTMTTNGTIEKLRNLAINEYLFVVNEAYDNKMMHYIGVMTVQELPEATRQIHFPKGTYITIPGEASSPYELAETLTELAFGDVLWNVSDYAYVGGPNAAVEMGEKDGKLFGEMWLPVEKQ